MCEVFVCGLEKSYMKVALLVFVGALGVYARCIERDCSSGHGEKNRCSRLASHCGRLKLPCNIYSTSIISLEIFVVVTVIIICNN
jgi:hypothetical protein